MSFSGVRYLGMRKTTATASAAALVRVAIYCRVSLDREGDELAVKRQERACRRWIKERGLAAAITLYVDNDVSGSKGKHRPEYEAMLSAVAAGEVDVLITYAADRLTRHPQEWERFIDVVDDAKIDVETIASGTIDLRTAGGRTMTRLVGVLARHEVEQMAERMTAKLAEKRERGVHHGGRRPFGYVHDRDSEGGLCIVAHEATAIRWAVDELLNGASLVGTARTLARDGVTGTGGSLINNRTLKRIVMTPTIAGLLTHEGEIIGDGRWTAIVEPAKWRELHKLLSDPTRAPKGRPTANLLAGYVVDSNGYTMSGDRRMRYRKSGKFVEKTYASKPGRNDGTGTIGVKGVHVKAEWLEQRVSEIIVELFAEVDLAEHFTTVEDEAELLAQLDAARIERASMTADYKSGALDYETYREISSIPVERISDLEAALEAAAARSPLVGYSGVGRVSELWGEDDFDQRRAILYNVVERIVVHPVEGVGRRANDTRQIDVELRADVVES